MAAEYYRGISGCSLSDEMMPVKSGRRAGVTRHALHLVTPCKIGFMRTLTHKEPSGAMPAELADGLGLPDCPLLVSSNSPQNASSPAPFNHEGIRRWSIGIHYTSLECKFKLNTVHMSSRDYMERRRAGSEYTRDKPRG